MKNNRRKGCQYERDLAKLFRELGWIDCKTSRYESRMWDDLKVDLTNTSPLQIQAKSTQVLANPFKTLDSMPQTEGKYNVIFNKRLQQGEIVILRKEDFIKMLKLLIDKYGLEF